MRRNQKNVTEDDFIMLPTVDFCFKELMQNENIRKGIVAALLKLHPEDVEKTDLMPTILQKQYEDDKPLPSCLNLGSSVKNRYIHIVVSHDVEYIYLITAYFPDLEKWENGFRTRKEC